MPPATKQLFEFLVPPGGMPMSEVHPFSSILKAYAVLTKQMVEQLGDGGGPELTAALRKLLESRDCMIRAATVAAGYHDLARAMDHLKGKQE